MYDTWRWALSVAAMMLVYADTIAGSDHQRINPASPMESNGPGIKPRAINPRIDTASTTASRRPTTSTPYAVPLTTTFIPPESCNQEQLTMLSPPGYFIWLNEPVPVPGTTVSDCYPPEFLEYYKTYHINPTIVGSMVPLMSPLVIPFGWYMVSNKDDYLACCPVGYSLTPPKTPLDPERPAYGGTCYSQWPLSSSKYIEVYGSASLSGSMLQVASTPLFANYAHVIDGIALSTSSSTTSVESAQNGDSQHNALAPGAIVGIVVGIVVALGSIAAGFFVYARRRHQVSSQKPPIPPPKDEEAFTTANNLMGVKTPIDSPASSKQTNTDSTEMEGESYVHELDAGQTPVEKP
ncbi:hypothetical protein F4678DRAFT_454216 [Xylaria arbuscula]|nr:hypothetical protein F4678DRAFT_454216 [Xylaria arbuscula]